MKRVGVLALQGDVVEHLHALRRIGVEAVEVKNERELASVDALIVPGGESTTVIRLLERFGLVEPIKARVRDGMPFWGTCMGMILAAKDVADMEQDTLGLLDITVRRNAFGRQIASAEVDLDVPSSVVRRFPPSLSALRGRARGRRRRSARVARRARRVRSSGQRYRNVISSGAHRRRSPARVLRLARRLVYETIRSLWCGA